MGKLADQHRLRCVHCHNTETPLWRAGPDGPKTLCNACGVRFKKGKLILYKDDAGNLTAVKRQDSVPVHVPPPAKKSSKKVVASNGTPSTSSSGVVEASEHSVTRKVSSEGSCHVSGLSGKPRSRVRRANAGQLPGRYASKRAGEGQFEWRSPTDSPPSCPSSPCESPRLSGRLMDGMSSCSLTCGSNASVDESIGLQQGVSYSDEDNLFADMACLGLDASVDPGNHTLLPMPADPSSAEQFTFAFSGLGRDACLALDTPDRAEALRALVLDRTRGVSTQYDTTVHSVWLLYEHRRQHCEWYDADGGKEAWGGEEACKSFVRSFAQIHNVSVGVDVVGAGLGHRCVPVCNSNPSAVMLSEKTLHSAAVESLRTLVDSTDLVGFAETCLIELLAEDVALASSPRSVSVGARTYLSICTPSSTADGGQLGDVAAF